MDLPTVLQNALVLASRAETVTNDVARAIFDALEQEHIFKIENAEARDAFVKTLNNLASYSRDAVLVRRIIDTLKKAANDADNNRYIGEQDDNNE